MRKSKRNMTRKHKKKNLNESYTNISKKNNLSLHGYFIASGIESLYLITTTNENLEFYNNKIGKKYLYGKK